MKNKIKQLIKFLLFPFNWIIRKIDTFIWESYFLIFYKKEILNNYKTFLSTFSNGWRGMSELQFYFFNVYIPIATRKIVPIKKVYLFASLLKKLKIKKRLFLKYPVYNFPKATTLIYNFNAVNSKVQKQRTLKKIGKNEKNICCNSGKKFKDCCLKAWYLPNDKEPKIRKLEMFKKTPSTIFDFKHL